MAARASSGTNYECQLLWKLARAHGWSASYDVGDLASDANIPDEHRGREVARDKLANRPYIGYHKGSDMIWIKGPPPEQVFYDLRDECGYGELQIEATFGSYFDGFS